MASPVSKFAKKQGGKATENTISKSIANLGQAKHCEEDPILRDLQASIQAENEIREIFSKKKNSQQHFKPPVLQNNLSIRPTDARKFSKDKLCPFSPPKRLSVNPMVHDQQFQVFQQQEPFHTKQVQSRCS